MIEERWEKLNKQYDIKALYKAVAKKLQEDNEKISFECHSGYIHILSECGCEECATKLEFTESLHTK